jgi:hypothetical protein
MGYLSTNASACKGDRNCRDGRTPYEVSRAERVIPNSLLAPCTFRLKLEPFRAWLKENFTEATIYIGYDFAEMHRMEATTKAYNELGYEIDYPLMWKPIEFRRYEDVVRSWGIKPPRMYQMGYTHANCGGRCCKQGRGDWIRTLINFPDRYHYVEEWEQGMRDLSEKHSHRSILKQVRGGETYQLTLRELRFLYEIKDGQMDLCKMDEESACVVCGIGG